ncbi:MAG: hypothetical protein AB1730_23350 [Myxococcota bacterium]|jgi:hypothetical protein
MRNKHLWHPAAVGLVIAGIAVAGNVTLPNTFQPNTPARAAEVNANFAAVKTAVDDNSAQISTLATRLTAAEVAGAALDTRVAAAETSITDLRTRSTYVAPTLQGNWVNVNGGWSTAGYLKDPLGFVHLRGLVRKQSAGGTDVLFTLPPGYAPSTTLQFPSRCGDGSDCYVVVRSNGEVAFGGQQSGALVSVALDHLIIDPQ